MEAIKKEKRQHLSLVMEKEALKESLRIGK